MNVELFTSSYSNNLDSVTRARGELTRLLSLCGDIKESRDDIVVVLAEVLNNLEEHSQASEFSLKLCKSKSQYVLFVCDDGIEFNHAPTSFSEIDMLAESGRGLSIIAACCHEYQFDQIDNKNRFIAKWNRVLSSNDNQVLVVEDDIVQLEIYKEYLSEEFRVFHASNANEAYKILKEQKVDVVISDINMPGEDGLSFRQKLLHDQHGLGLIPFIFSTGLSKTSIREKANHLAADDYLIKPVTKKGLLTAINRAIDRTQYIISQVSNRLDYRVTRALFPSLTLNGLHWRAAARARNSGCGGGDIIQHRKINEECELIVISDVMGHDLYSKFFSFSYAGYIRGVLESIHDFDSPADILNWINNCACKDNVFSEYPITLQVIALYPENAITIASAGHPQPLLVSSDGIKEIACFGSLVGLLPGQEYECIELVINPGERLCLYTDGLFESSKSDTGRRLLEVEMKESLRLSASNPLEQAIVNTMNTFDTLTRTDELDDTSIILIEPC